MVAAAHDRHGARVRYPARHVADLPFGEVRVARAPDDERRARDARKRRTEIEPKRLASIQKFTENGMVSNPLNVELK